VEAPASQNGNSEQCKGNTVAALMAQQVEAANVIVLNKLDLFESDDSLASARAILRELNEKAVILPTQRSNVDLDQVLNTRLFGAPSAAQPPTTASPHIEGGACAEGGGGHGHVHAHSHGGVGDSRKSEAERLDISSFVFRASRPFHPARLFKVASDSAQTLGAEVIRSKGFVWLATRPDVMGVWSLAGGHVSLSAGEPWWATLDKKDWPKGLESEVKGSDVWHETYGDRQQELVVIGIGMQEIKVRAELDACLLSDEEMTHEMPGFVWPLLHDPWPEWLDADE